MKLNPKILVKATKRLFMDKYQYKVVLVCPVASWFRGANLDFAKEKLLLIDNKVLPLDTPLWSKLKTKQDLDYCIQLESTLSKFNDFDIRVEHPLLSFYSNNFNDIITLSNVDVNRTKYVSQPSTTLHPKLEKNTIFLPKINYGFRVTMGKTRTSYASFISWTENNSKVKMTNNAIRDLGRDRSWGGCYFYVKDEKCLTMVKMFLGSEIGRIDRIINELPT
jgi:hypothetical protein